jgi:hypothetical protein
LRTCSGGISSLGASTNPCLLLERYRLALSCAHLRERSASAWSSMPQRRVARRGGEQQGRPCRAATRQAAAEAAVATCEERPVGIPRSICNALASLSYIDRRRGPMTHPSPPARSPPSGSGPPASISGDSWLEPPDSISFSRRSTARTSFHPSSSRDWYAATRCRVVSVYVVEQQNAQSLKYQPLSVG